MASIARSSDVASRTEGFDFVPYALCLAVGIPLATWLGGFGYPCPGADDAVYKSPAAELVQHGRMAIPCMQGFLPTSEIVFASYPPVYQLVLSVWYLVFDVSLRSSIAFTYVVHLLSAMALMGVTRRLLVSNAGLPLTSRRGIILAVGIIHVGNLAYFDRPEEMALLWIWLDVLRVRGAGGPSRVSSCLISGVLLGLAALTAPFVGILGAIVVVLRVTVAAVQGPASSSPANWLRNALQLSTVATVSLGMVLAWYVAMEKWYPGAIDSQLFGTLRHLNEARQWSHYQGTLREFQNAVLYNRPQLLSTFAVVLLFPAVVLGSPRGSRRSPPTLVLSQTRNASPLAIALFLAGIIGLAITFSVRPDAYTYLAACQMVLLPCLGPVLGRYLARGQSDRSRQRTAAGLILLIACVSFALQQVASLGISARRLPRLERPDAVFDRLTAVIPEGDTVAVGCRHWHAFQGRNPWREAFFSPLVDPSEVLKCQWLVTTPAMGTPSFIEAFELVEKVPTQLRHDQTYAYSLWRRREAVDLSSKSSPPIAKTGS